MIDIFVTTFNRKPITERCLTLIRDNIPPGTKFYIIDDKSQEYDARQLNQFAPDVRTSVTPFQETMLREVVKLKHSKPDTLLYMCDNDILHDPCFMTVLQNLYNEYKLPITLSNSKLNKQKIVKENEEVIIQKTFFGTSLLLCSNHLQHISDYAILNMKLTKDIDQDLHLCQVMNRSIVRPQISYSDHYPGGGLHANMDDIGINLTPFLRAEREKFKDVKYW